MHEVDGRPLEHWNKSNFQQKRDESCRVVYEPKDGKAFFLKNLPPEDYEVMRTMSLEQPYFSKYNRFFPSRGHFCCKACGNALYSHVTKFDAEDGWPAFGACVDGAIGIIPSEKLKAEIEIENRACIKIQSFVRAALCRIRVTQMLDDLIQEMLKEKEHGQDQDAVDLGDNDKGNIVTSRNDAAVSFQRRKSSMLRASSFMVKKMAKTQGLKYTMLRAFGDDYTEIHCHRCKSHLGDIVEEENLGRNGRMFQERHRVNGRALKYVEDNLPKRIVVDTTLLFANQSQRRRLGLPEMKREVEQKVPLRTTPFVSPRAKRKKLLTSAGVVIEPLVHDPLAISPHSSRGAIRPKQMKSFDPLSVSCHPDIGIHETVSSRQPVRRGKRSNVNIKERRAALEQQFMSLSLH
jgi:peptide methionine sulfoxide reductase MsrB